MSLDLEGRLTKKELMALKALAKGSYSVSELADKVGGGQPRTSMILRGLVRKGFVEMTREGKTKEVELASSKHAILFRNLVTKHPHIPWEEVLSHSSIPILLALLEGQNDADEIRSETGISSTSVWRWLRRLGSYGIIQKKDKRYEVNPRHDLLIDFLQEYRLHLFTRLAREVSLEAVILWHGDFESLLRVPKDMEVGGKGFHVTAVSRFDEMGIPIILNYDYYFYSEKRESLRREDSILHTLLIEKDSPRYVLYALLALKKFEGSLDKQYLLSEAARYGLERQVAGMLRFLEDRVKTEGIILPSWEGFYERAIDYGVI